MEELRERWYLAQEREWGFWGCRVDGRDDRTFPMKECRDWWHQRRFLDFIAKTVGFEHPNRVLAEIGVGACGVLPYLTAGDKIGVEPLKEQFEQNLGTYQDRYGLEVWGQPFEDVDDDAWRGVWVLFSFNVLDHVIEPTAVLRKILDELAPRHIVMQTDLRSEPTELHPSTVDRSMFDIFDEAYDTGLEEMTEALDDIPDPGLWRWMVRR
jgi:hypothetical protein